jgi:hypothetical protein
MVFSRSGTRAADLHIIAIGLFAMRRAQPMEVAAGCLIHTIHRNRNRRQTLFKANKSKGRSMTSKADEAAIDEATIDDIVARCGGDVRGALKALLLVNEHLEAELQELYASADRGMSAQRGSNALH